MAYNWKRIERLIGVLEDRLTRQPMRAGGDSELKLKLNQGARAKCRVVARCRCQEPEIAEESGD